MPHQSATRADITRWKQLYRVLKLAKAPITGRRVAVILRYDDGGETFGFNREKSGRIKHAEIMALQRTYAGSKIADISIMANGSQVDHAMPCDRCCAALIRRSLPNTKVNLYWNDRHAHFSLALHDIRSRYRPFASVPRARRKTVRKFLQTHTFLTAIDRNMVAAICERLHAYNNTHRLRPVELYISGSASGRGGPKSLLAKQMTGVAYWDVDLIFIFPKNIPGDVHEFIRRTYQESLNEIGCRNQRILSKTVPSYILELGAKDPYDFHFRKIFWAKGMPLELRPPHTKKNQNVPSSIDVSVGRSLASTMTPNYLKRKWYLRLV